MYVIDSSKNFEKNKYVFKFGTEMTEEKRLV